VNRTLVELVAIRKQREQRAQQRLAARKLQVTGCAQQLQHEREALRRSREEHARLKQRLHEDAQSGAHSAAQICAALAYLQHSQKGIDQRHNATMVAQHALRDAVAAMDASRLLYRRAYTASERANLLDRRTRKSAIVRRNALEELANEESREAGRVSKEV
jgi:hypothetical protein